MCEQFSVEMWREKSFCPSIHGEMRRSWFFLIVNLLFLTRNESTEPANLFLGALYPYGKLPIGFWRSALKSSSPHASSARSRMYEDKPELTSRKTFIMELIILRSILSRRYAWSQSMFYWCCTNNKQICRLLRNVWVSIYCYVPEKLLYSVREYIHTSMYCTKIGTRSRSIRIIKIERWSPRSHPRQTFGVEDYVPPNSLKTAL
jgi:hypothetical protein